MSNKRQSYYKVLPLHLHPQVQSSTDLNALNGYSWTMTWHLCNKKIVSCALKRPCFIWLEDGDKGLLCKLSFLSVWSWNEHTHIVTHTHDMSKQESYKNALETLDNGVHLPACVDTYIQTHTYGMVTKPLGLHNITNPHTNLVVTEAHTACP